MTELLSILHPLVQEALQKYGIQSEAMECDPTLADTAAFCEHYKFSFDNTCNAIIAIGKATPPKYACCVVLANSKVDVNKKVCQLLDVKKGSFAAAEQTLELSGMQIGGVTPVGLPAEIPIFVDTAVMNNEKIVLGGGNRSSKLLLNPNELKKIPNLHFVDGLGIRKDLG